MTREVYATLYCFYLPSHKHMIRVQHKYAQAWSGVLRGLPIVFTDDVNALTMPDDVPNSGNVREAKRLLLNALMTELRERFCYN